MIREIKQNYLHGKNGDDDPVKWIHLHNPSSEEIDEILQEYPMPRDFISSGLDEDEFPRYETFVNSKGEHIRLFVFLTPVSKKHNPGNKGKMNYYSTMPISFVISDNYIITTSLENYSVIKYIINQDYDDCFSTYTWLMKVFWIISREYILHLKQIDKQIDELEENVADTTDNAILYDLIGINKALIFFQSSLQGNSKILTAMEEDANKQELSQRQKAMLRDVQIEHRQALVLVLEYKEITEQLSDMLSNVINNNMNIVMKRLTGWTILITVPTIVGGLFGMNVALPFEDNPHGFLIILILIAIISYVVYKWLVRNNYM